MNPIIESLYQRKSVRAYTDREIPEETVQTILAAATQAPSPGNQQLYTIIRISDPELKRRLSESCDHQPFIEKAKLVLVFCADCLKWYKAYREGGCEARAPDVGDLLLAVSDANIAAQNAVVAAEALGVGSCYIGDIMENIETQREILGLPKYVSPEFEEMQIIVEPATAEPAEEVIEEPQELPAEETAPEAEPEAAPEDAADDVPAADTAAAEEIADTESYVEDEPEDDAPEEIEDVSNDGDDMYVRTRNHKGVGIIIVALLVLGAVIAGGYYLVRNNDFLRPVKPTSTDTTTVNGTTADTDTTTTPADDKDATDKDATDKDATKQGTTKKEQTTADNAGTTKQTTTKPATTKQSTTKQTTTKQSTTKQSTTRQTTTRQSTTRQSTTRQTTTRQSTTRQTTTRQSTTRQTTTQSTTQKPAATTLVKPTRTFAKRTMYLSANGVALRYAPDKNSPSRVSLSVGNDVSVTAEQNGFYYVYSGRYGLSGWVSKSYLSDSRPVATTEQQVSGVVKPDYTYSSPETKTVNAHAGVHLRKGPGTSYDVIRNVGNGFPVTVKGASSTVSGWVYVTDTTHGVSGWVASAYLK